MVKIGEELACWVMKNGAKKKKKDQRKRWKIHQRHSSILRD